MSHRFFPEGFFETAKELKQRRSGTEADLRTAVGRAYYAAYGAAKARYLAAHGKPNEKFLHGQIGGIIMTVAPGHPVRKAWNSLQQMRGISDYEYGRPITRSLAEAALTNSDILLTAYSKRTTLPSRTYPSDPHPEVPIATIGTELYVTCPLMAHKIYYVNLYANLTRKIL